MTTPPQGVTVTADKASYQVGDPITVTVEYPDPANPGTTLTITGTVTAPDGTFASGTTSVQVGSVPAQALPVAVSDSFGGAYSQVSDDPGTAVFSGTVIAPPAGP